MRGGDPIKTRSDRCGLYPQAREPRVAPVIPYCEVAASEAGVIGVLSIYTTRGLVDIALDLQSADAIVAAIHEIRSKLEPTDL